MVILNFRNSSRLILLALVFFLVTLNFPTLPAETQIAGSPNITSQTNKQIYDIREPVVIQGTFTHDGSPITDALIALQIEDPRSGHFIFRTIPIGSPEEFWSVNITEVYITDQNNNPIPAAKIDTTIKWSISVKNNLLNSLDVVIASALYDNNLIPIRTTVRQVQLSAQGTATVTGLVYIPQWVTPGEALISVNVYNRLPQDGGFPYAPEKQSLIYITRNEQLPPEYSPLPDSYEDQPGEYQIFLRMPPDEFTQAGIYDVYVTGRETLLTIASVSTSFIMQTDPSPPQAAFTYYPPTLYANMSATFDASSSSAEGFNDTITRYEWYFYDPNDPEQIINDGSTPLAFHTFEFGGTYLVSLNVTDNEGLWSYTVKPILIYPEYGPTANFTWTPSQPRANGTTTFNATISEPGWSAATADFSPIVQYKWNFDDGTGNITIPDNPVIAHIYTQPGNYSVMLEVTDSMGRSDMIIKDLEVSIITGNLYDINGDGYVGIDDIVMVAEKFGTQVGDPDWDPRCDVTGDDYVGIDDIVLVAEHFGETD